jgi:hypothetical protein
MTGSVMAERVIVNALTTWGQDVLGTGVAAGLDDG